MGRAGRRGDVSVAVLVASPAPVDQYVIHHPEFVLGGQPEEARLDPDNLHVLLAHLRAATFELPFEPGEWFGPGPADDLLAFLGEGGQVRQADDGRWYWSSENFPASEVSLRAAAPENVVIIDDTPGPAARPRRGGPVQRAGARPPARDLHARLHPVPRGPAGLGRAQGLRAQGGRGPLHVREPGRDAQAARRVRDGAGDRRDPRPRRGDGREPRHAVQEAQVHHRRERGLGTHRPAGDRAPDDRVLAHRGGSRRGLAARRARRGADRRRARDPGRGRGAADARPA